MEDLVRCPYDRNHTIRPNRLALHLNKCKVNHPNVQVVQCRFDSTHILPKDDERVRDHYEHCPSRSTLESYLNRPENENNSPPPSGHGSADRDTSPDGWSVVGRGSSRSRRASNRSGRGLTRGTCRGRTAIDAVGRSFNAMTISSPSSSAPTRTRANRGRGGIPAAQPSIEEASGEQENWDDLNVPSYDPLQHVEQNPIIRNANGLQPAERKQFRREERFRLIDLKGEGPTNDDHK